MFPQAVIGLSFMDALSLLSKRRSVPPQFLENPGPERQVLEQILTIAMRVPDHGKLAPWRFIVFEGNAREKIGESFAAIALKAHSDMTEEKQQEEKRRFLRAPLVVCVVSQAGPHVKIPEWEQLLSCGAVCMNLIHACHAYGFAANWLTEWIAYDRDALQAIGLEEYEKMAGIIYIGKPNLEPTDRPRPITADKVSYLST
jgi:nitroreductase